MINIHIHWAVIAMAIIIIAGIVVCYRFSKDDNFGLNTIAGVAFLLVCILAALVLGGIFIW